MAGKAATPPSLAGDVLNQGVDRVAANRGLTTSEMNSNRISEVMDRLSFQVRTHQTNGSVEFFNLCLSLAKRIDVAMANHDVPSRALELPSLLKQVSLHKNDVHLQAAIMVLMISIKSACLSGWFSDKESEELRNLTMEIASDFCNMSNFNSEPNCSNSVITTIMSRFYPRMKMGHVFVFLEVKPGFDAYASDFQISKNLKSSPGDKIRLLVVQMDNIHTSSCLISPSKVNFLVNGQGVERRTNLFMDTGPQIPTVVTHLLRYGLNLLQAVGEFNGNYIIAVAFMSEIPNPDQNALQDYQQHAPPTVDSDPEIIEGPSRISLNCPISFRRIKTPVKGHSCRHFQCFDFDNYVDINSRRPSWRCPHCNQHVCFDDIRIDQKMVKILKEVGTNTTNIIVSSDGSWNAIMDIDDASQKPEDRTSNFGQNDSPQPESVCLLNLPVDILDLTQTNDAMDAVATHETEDRKLSTAACQSQSLTETMVGNPHTTNTNDVNQSSAHAEDDSWSRIYLSTFGLGSLNVRSNAQNTSAFVSTSNYTAAPSVLTDNCTSVSNGEIDSFHANADVITSAPQRETSLSNTFRLQQYQFECPAITNEHGRFPSIPNDVTRTPNAVQALPAQTSTSVLQQRSRNSVNTFVQNGLSTTYQATPGAPFITNSAIRPNPFQMSSSPLNQHLGIQQNRPLVSVRPPHRVATCQALNSHIGLNEHQSSIQRMVNLRMPVTSSPSPALIQPSPLLPTNFLLPQSQVGASQDRTGHTTGAVNSQQAHLIAAANRTMHMALDSTRTVTTYSMNPIRHSMLSVGDRGVNSGVRPQPGVNSGVRPQPVTRTDVNNPADQNWRPTGRMRGALYGQAYTDALNQYIIQPNQQAQAARPISNMTSLPDNIPPQLQSFMAENVAQNPPPNHPSAVPDSRPAVSGFIPDGSAWMH